MQRVHDVKSRPRAGLCFTPNHCDRQHASRPLPGWPVCWPAVPNHCNHHRLNLVFKRWLQLGFDYDWTPFASHSTKSTAVQRTCIYISSTTINTIRVITDTVRQFSRRSDRCMGAQWRKKSVTYLIIFCPVRSLFLLQNSFLALVLLLDG